MCSCSEVYLVSLLPPSAPKSPIDIKACTAQMTCVPLLQYPHDLFMRMYLAQGHKCHDRDSNPHSIVLLAVPTIDIPESIQQQFFSLHILYLIICFLFVVCSRLIKGLEWIANQIRRWPPPSLSIFSYFHATLSLLQEKAQMIFRETIFYQWYFFSGICLL